MGVMYSLIKSYLGNRNRKFLGIALDNINFWKKHTDSIIGKLNKSCYIIRKSKQYLCIEALKMVYYAIFHSLISYVSSFGETELIVSVFKFLKRVIRIMVGASKTDSCRKFFTLLKILPLPSKYIL
jgi:hypothetical protein